MVTSEPGQKGKDKFFTIFFVITLFIIEEHCIQHICLITVYPFIRLLPSIKNDDIDLHALTMEIQLPHIEKKR